MDSSDEEWFESFTDMLLNFGVLDEIVEADQKNIGTKKRPYKSHHLTKDLW